MASINAQLMLVFIIGNVITSIDFDPSGILVATIDAFGVCLISDVSTNSYVGHKNIGTCYGNAIL